LTASALGLTGLNIWLVSHWLLGPLVAVFGKKTDKFLNA
jgi:hypothetical protein